MIITEEQLQKIYKNTKADLIHTYIGFLNTALQKYFIVDHKQVCAYLATIGRESGGLVHIEENLMYSSDALERVFNSHFSGKTEMAKYAFQPEKIANRVYANRMGNGDEASGDGWLYRGRGLIQITGKNNYTYMLNHYANTCKTIDDLINYLMIPEGATMSSAWFWNWKNCNNYEDNMEAITRLINGGLNDIIERKALYDLAAATIPDVPTEPVYPPTVIIPYPGD